MISKNLFYTIIRALLLVCASLFFTTTQAQQKLSEKELRNEISKLFNAQQALSHKGEHDSGLLLLNKALELSQQYKNKGLEASTYLNMARVYDFKNDHKKTYEYAKKSLDIFKTKKIKAGQADALMVMGISFENTDKKAFKKYMLRAKKMAEESGNGRVLGAILNNLGVFYMVSGEYAVSKGYFLESYNLRVKLKDERGIANTCGNLGYLTTQLGEYEETIKYSHKTLSFGKKVENKQFIDVAIINIGNAYLYLEQYDSAIKYYRDLKANGLKFKDSLSIFDGYLNIAVVNEKQGQYLKSLKNNLKAEEYFNAKFSEKTRALHYRNVAVIFERVFLHKKAKQYYDRSLEEYQSINDSVGIAKCYNGLGIYYKTQGMYDSALVFFNRALTIKEGLEGIQNVGNVLNNIGSVYHKLKQDSLSNYYYNKAISKSSQERDLKTLAQATQNLGNYFVRQGEFTKALPLLDSALAIIGTNAYPKLKSEIYNSLSETHDGLGNYEQAKTYRREYKTITDSLFSAEELLKVSALAFEKELLDKENEKEKLSTEKSLAEEKSTSRLLTIIIVACISILLITALVLVLRKRVKQNQKTILQKEAMEEQTQQLSYELDAKKKEIIAMALSIKRQNDVLDKVKENLLDIKNEDAQIESVKLINKEKDEVRKWENFSERFTMLHPKFLSSIRNKHKNLTPSEIRLCMFIRLEMSVAEIASIFNIANSSVTVSRYRLKKKLGLTKEQSLEDYLNEF